MQTYEDATRTDANMQKCKNAKMHLPPYNDNDNDNDNVLFKALLPNGKGEIWPYHTTP